jgi:class 3 adenylate cyclase/tetratricopeptide (TPR) repeat protein
MKCPRCGEENRPDRRFCGQCGASLALACAACGFSNDPGEKFCGGCGQPLGGATTSPKFAEPVAYTPRHLAEKILTSKAALEGERKQVTVLFCDIANSTGLAERLGPEAMHSVLNKFFDIALAEVHRYEGTINQFLGDGFMALFGAPVAHEDHARRAVLAALELQRVLREKATDFDLLQGRTLAVRMGLNTGLVVVGTIGDDLRMDYTAVGDTTNLAARLQQVAEPEMICLSETTRRFVSPYFECEALGERTLKGKTVPVVVYRVLRAHSDPTQSRSETRPVGSKLIGRDAEFTQLLGCLDRLTAGQGGIVSIIGEAGLGKSRLVAEIRANRAGRSLLWLEGRALSFGRSLSYWPVREILRQWISSSEEEREAESLVKLEHAVDALFPDEVEDILPYLATLLGLTVPQDVRDRVRYLDNQALGRQIFRSSRRLFERLARRQPLVLVFDDLHWADQSSTELVEHLFPLVNAVPLLLCVVGRPERHSSATHLRDLAYTTYAARYTEVVLNSLPPHASSELVDSLFGSRDIATRLKQAILQKTEGNPFFVEEVIRALIAAGTLAWDSAGGHWLAVHDTDQVTIPDTLQGVIMARVDRLDDDVKQLLKAAAVIGRIFFYRVLQSIAASRAMDRHLAELQQWELIREKRRAPELEYIFKHALVRDATYESILSDRRRDLHGRVAECIETIFRDRLDEFVSLLAYHYAQAEQWDKAQEYLFKAGDQAGRVAADSEALTHYEQAMAAHARVFGDRWDTRERAALERKIGEALFRKGNHAEALAHLQHALQLLGRHHPQSPRAVATATIQQLMIQLWHRVMPRRMMGREMVAAESIADERRRIYEAVAWIDYFVDQQRFLLDAITLLNFSESQGDHSGIVVGSMATGTVCDLLSLSGVARSYHRRAMRAAEESGSPVAKGFALLGLASHEYFRGQWDAASEHYRRGAELSRSAGDLRRWGATLGMLFHLCLHRGKFAECLDQARQVLEAGQEGGDSAVLGWGLQMLGIIYRELGQLDEAALRLTKGVDVFLSIPDHAGAAETTADLARCYLHKGMYDDALTAIEASGERIAKHGLRGHQVTTPRIVLAEVCLARVEERHPSAELSALQNACATARRQGKIFLEGLPAALRLTGAYEWLVGKGTAARRSWAESLATARSMGAVYDIGLTYAEMGKRLQDRTHLEESTKILAEVGAQFDLAVVSRELAQLH